MKFIDTVTADHYMQQMPNSSTYALLVICDDGNEYVLKHPGGTQSEYGTSILIAEYLSYLVAKRFNLPIPDYRFIRLTEKFIRTVDDESIYNMLKDCPELCVGSVFIHGALPFQKLFKVKNNAYKILFKTIFGFDQYIYNSDRFPENPNLLFIPQTNELKVIDHSLAIWPILDYGDSLDTPTINYSKHVLYPYIKGNLSYMEGLIKGIYDVTIRYYIDTIPDEWFNEDINKGFLTEFLKIGRDNISNILTGRTKCPEKNTNTNLSLF